MTVRDKPDIYPLRLLGHQEWRTPFGTFLGETRIRLLEAIAEHGSISKAAPHIPLSYKAAWDAIDAMNNLSAQSLVERSAGGQRGGGTRLTEHGRAVVALYRAMEREYQQILDHLAGDLGSGFKSLRQYQSLVRGLNLRASARNQFACIISQLSPEEVDCEVRLRLDAEIELIANVTRESARQLALEPGTEVIALVKASSVMVLTQAQARTSASNHIWGEISRIHEGPINTEVVIRRAAGKNVAAVITADSARHLQLRVGQRACAVFNASSVILNVL